MVLISLFPFLSFFSISWGWHVGPTLPLLFRFKLNQIYTKTINTGHSFCKQCMEIHAKKNPKKLCPFCRKPITSQCVNFQLQQVIMSLVQKKSEVSEANQAEKVRQEKVVTSYARTHRLLDVRVAVMENSLIDARNEEESLKDKEKAVELVVSHVKEEQQRVEAKLLELQRELQFIRDHLGEQHTKLQEIKNQKADASEKVVSIQKTLLPLKRERDKLKLLSDGVAQGIVGLQ